MIRFNYRCSQCGHEFAELVETHDQEVFCPVCNYSTKKLVSAPNVIVRDGNFATGIRKDLIDFQEVTMEESLKDMVDQ